METGETPVRPPVSTDAARGATVQSYYAVREMKIYPVAEHELDALTTMNTLTTVLFTVGTGLISLAVGIWVTALFTEKVTPAGDVLSKFGAWVLVALGILCLLLTCWTGAKRRATWAKIIRESGDKA
jgi:hypothetical protein